MRHTADTITDDELDRLYAERELLVGWVATLADMPEGWVREQLADAGGTRQPQEGPCTPA